MNGERCSLHSAPGKDDPGGCGDECVMSPLAAALFELNFTLELATPPSTMEVADESCTSKLNVTTELAIHPPLWRCQQTV
jgi:hypothetical protein